MAPRHKDIWPRVASFQNLSAAYLECRRGKRQSASALHFSETLEGRIIALERQLLAETWQPSPPREFMVRDPKPRFIQAPTFSDRVVHHAIVRQIEPIFEKAFIHDSYACRKGKGVHAAVARVQKFLRAGERQWPGVWVLQCDVAKYFASINHQKLLEIIAGRINDRPLLRLIARTLAGYGYDGGTGIPVGALTSQLCANIYLDHFDHWIKDEVGQRYYVRYMDDFLVIGADKQSLWRLHEAIGQFLATELRLCLHRKSRVFPARLGVDFCGYRTWSTHILPRKRNVRRARQRFKNLSARYARGDLTSAEIQPAVASFVGYMKHCSGTRTQAAIMNDIVLRRGVA